MDSGTLTSKFRQRLPAMFQPRKTYSSVAPDEVELVKRAKPPELVSAQYVDHGQQQDLHSAQKNSKNRQFRDNFKVSWRLLGHRLYTRMLPLFVLQGLIVTFVLMVVYSHGITGLQETLCNPNGDFDLSTTPYNPWGREGIFSINMKYGRFSFTQAKFIDVAWDVGIGRGGQAALAIYTCAIFTRGLTRIMECRSVSHGIFKAVTIQDNTIWGVIKLLTNFSKVGGWRAKSAIAWIIISSLFVLLVPTWLSAMTGYVSYVTDYIEDNDTKLVQAKSFQPLIYTIHDGSRLGEGFSNEWPILVPWSRSGIDEGNNYACYGKLEVNNGTMSFYNVLNEDCKWLWAVSWYVRIYGFFGSTYTIFPEPQVGNSTTSLRSFSPALNISAHLAYTSYTYSDPYGANLGLVRENQTGKPGQINVTGPLFAQGTTGVRYNFSQMNERGTCRQERDVLLYQWGFSFILLYVFVGTLIVWITGMWIFYINSTRFSVLYERHMGYERAVLDLSEAMKERLDLNRAEYYSDSQIYPLVQDATMTYTHLVGGTQKVRLPLGFVVKNWIKDEKWWLCAMLVCTGPWFGAAFSSFYLNLFIGWIPGLGIFFVLVLGRDFHGRWVVFLVSLLIYAIWVIVFLDYVFSNRRGSNQMVKSD